MIQHMKAVLEDANAEYAPLETNFRLKSIAEDQMSIEVIINHMEKMWVATVDYEDIVQEGATALHDIIEEIDNNLVMSVLSGQTIEMVNVREL